MENFGEGISLGELEEEFRFEQTFEMMTRYSFIHGLRNWLDEHKVAM